MSVNLTDSWESVTPGVRLFCNRLMSYLIIIYVCSLELILGDCEWREPGANTKQKKSFQRCQFDFEVIQMQHWDTQKNDTILKVCKLMALWYFYSRVLLCTRQWISSSVDGWLIIPAWPPNPRSKTKRKDLINTKMYCGVNTKHKLSLWVKLRRACEPISRFINSQMTQRKGTDSGVLQRAWTWHVTCRGCYLLSRASRSRHAGLIAKFGFHG